MRQGVRGIAFRGCVTAIGGALVVAGSFGAGVARAAEPVTVTALKPAVVGQGATKTIAITGTGFESGAVASVSGTGVTVKRTSVGDV